MKAIIAILGGKRATAFAIASVLALGLAGLQTLRLSHAQTAIADARTLAAEQAASLAEANRLASERARRIEHELATRVDAIANGYERGKRDAEHKADAVVADLRAGTVRLRDEWRGCEARLSGTDPAAAERDAATQRRIEAAGAVVRVGAEADEQLAACQAVVRALTDGQHASRPGN